MTSVLTPLVGRAIPLADLPDPIFSQGMVGYGAAVDPLREVVEVVAPVSGTVLKLLPHAFIVMTSDNVGVLVHLGIDTVALRGQGFTPRVSQGDVVVAGQHMITYDVPVVVAAGLVPAVPVVIMDERDADNIAPGVDVTSGAEIILGSVLFTAFADR